MLTSLIEQGNQAVNDKFGIIPIKSTYSLYQDSDWFTFCINRNENPVRESLYLPRTYSAHLKDKTNFLEIYLLHEYFGHGLFCEYSKIGKKIVKFEQELAELEKLMLGVDKLPQNKKITITNENPYFYDYKKLREEYQQFFNHHFIYYEGFAFWMQYNLSEKLDLIEKWEKLKQKLPEELKGLLKSLDQLRKKSGDVSILEWAGIS